jgi:hypothetical protein
MNPNDPFSWIFGAIFILCMMGGVVTLIAVVLDCFAYFEKRSSAAEIERLRAARPQGGADKNAR